MAKDKTKKGFILRAPIDGEPWYLNHRQRWETDIDRAWVYAEIPSPERWAGHIEPKRFAVAEYREGDGVIRTGRWRDWSQAKELGTKVNFLVPIDDPLDPLTELVRIVAGVDLGSMTEAEQAAVNAMGADFVGSLLAFIRGAGDGEVA